MDKVQVSHILIYMFIFGPHVYGQTTSSKTSKSKKTTSSQATVATKTSAMPSKESTERITVVGSRIKRSEQEGPIQVLRIDGDTLRSTGYNSLSEVMRNLPQNSFGNFVDDGTNATTPSLRGIGSANTLLLVDGRRMVKDANTERADMSMIPLAAIYEVQILLGGASAIYGSDALGGVINVITKKDYDGTAFSGSYTGTKLGGGEETTASWVWGNSSESSSSFNVLQYQKIQPLFWNDRDWTDAQRQFGIGDPASFLGEDQMPYVVDLGRCSVFGGEDSTVCGSDWAGDWNYFQNEVEQVIAFSQFRRDIAERHEFKAGFFLLNKEIDSSSTANFLRNDLVPASLLDGLDLPIAPLIVDGKVYATGFLNAAGPRTSHTSLTTYSVSAGFDGALSETIDYAANISYADSKVQSESKNSLLEKELFAAMEDGKFNPFKPVGEQGSLDSAKVNLFGKSSTKTTTADFGVSGELFENWAGIVEFASGYNLVKESMNVDDGQTVLPDNEGNYRVFGYSGTFREAQRKIDSVYLELKLPLLKSLNLTAAGRLDKYSDVGNSFTPASSLEYRPLRSLLLRASYTEGFKAPTLDNINSPLSKGFGFGRDYRECGKPSDSDTGYCESTQPVDSYTGGNPNLKPEISTTYGLGFVWDIYSNFSITADFYHTKIKDEITEISIDDALKYENDNRLPDGVIITRGDDGKLVSIQLPLLNIGTRTSEGYDLGINYSYRTRWGRFVWEENVAVKTVSKWQTAPGEDYNNDLFYLPKWRNVSGLKWSLFGHGVSLVNNHIDAKRWRADDTPKVPSYNYWNLSYAYTFSKGSSISLGGINVTQTKPPVDTSSTSGLSRGISQSLYGIKGPSYFVKFDYII